MDDLDVDPEVKQLFRDVFKEDPASRPTAMDLLQKPMISSAYEYGICFDEYYESEDSEGFESLPPQTADFSAMDSGPHETSSHMSSSGHPSLNSMGDVVGDLPKFVESPTVIRGRRSQDSGVGGDLENSINGGTMFGAQLSMRSSSSGSAGQSRLVHQDSGLEDMVGGECAHPERPGEWRGRH